MQQLNEAAELSGGIKKIKVLGKLSQKSLTRTKPQRIFELGRERNIITDKP
jgi:hypothetical protein